MQTFIGILSLVGLLFIVASPIVLIWGFYRALIFTGVEVVAEAAEKVQGATFADKQKKWGYYLMLIAIVLCVLGLLFVHIGNVYTT